MSLSHVSLPLPDDIDLARESASILSKLLSEAPEEQRATVKLSDADIILPRIAIELLRDILADMSQGNAVTIMPLHAEMTTQQAANFLNVSRPYLVKLLETGEIPFVKVGSHRRIQLMHLVTYRDSRQKKSLQAMNILTELSQEHDMGY